MKITEKSFETVSFSIIITGTDYLSNVQATNKAIQKPQ
jgi:hypothetical protein